MKILGIIPARGGSKGIPGKNIKLLGEKPLLQYTFDSAKASNLLTRVILSSESAEIIEIANRIKLEVPFTRPSKLADDSASSLDVVKHALSYFKERNESFDAVCLLQPTTPFREQELIDMAISKFIKDDFDALISVREVPKKYNPHWTFTNENGLLKIATGERVIISRRQELPKAFHRDGAIYITKSSVIFESNSLYGNKIGFIDTTGAPDINLDQPEDWIEAESFLQKNK